MIREQSISKLVLNSINSRRVKYTFDVCGYKPGNFRNIAELDSICGEQDIRISAFYPVEFRSGYNGEKLITSVILEFESDEAATFFRLQYK